MITAEQQKEIVESINRILEATRAGQIVWTRANPTTMVWTKNPGRAAIQRVEQAKQQVDPASRRVTVTKTVSFLLQLTSIPTSVQLLSVSSSEDATIAPLLEALYNTAEQAVLGQGLHLLKQMLP